MEFFLLLLLRFELLDLSCFDIFESEFLFKDREFFIECEMLSSLDEMDLELSCFINFLLDELVER